MRAELGRGRGAAQGLFADALVGVQVAGLPGSSSRRGFFLIHAEVRPGRNGRCRRIPPGA